MIKTGSGIFPLPLFSYITKNTPSEKQQEVHTNNENRPNCTLCILFIMLYADIEGCNHIWLSEETGSIVFDLARVWHTPLKTSIPAKLKAFTAASKPDMPLTLDEKDLDSCLNKEDFFVNPERFTEKL